MLQNFAQIFRLAVVNLDKQVVLTLSFCFCLEYLSQAIRDSTFGFSDTGGGITLSTLFSVANNTHITIERCKIESNDAPSASEAEYAISIRKTSSTRVDIRNCRIANNKRVGGIGIRSESSPIESKPTHGASVNLVENEFRENSLGGGIIEFNSTGSRSDANKELVNIVRNIIVHNNPHFLAGVINVNGVYVNIRENIVLNNTGGRMVRIRQDSMDYMSQECIDNLIYNNIGMEINKKYTIESAGKGVRYHGNSIQNLANIYEIEAVTGGDVLSNGDDILNATFNWWGLPDFTERFRDSKTVHGYATVLYRPSLLQPPRNLQDCMYIIVLYK